MPGLFNKIIFNDTKNIFIEAGTMQSWAQYMNSEDVFIGLKSFGLSGPAKDVYEYFQKSNFNFQKSSEDDVIKELTKIRGIGLWSAQMFLIFVLYRINIFSKGDLALMNSLKINYKIDVRNTDLVDKLIDKWSPYKTVASLILWKSIEEKYFYA